MATSKISPQKKTVIFISIALALGFIMLAVVSATLILIYLDIDGTAKKLDKLLDHAERDLEFAEASVALLGTIAGVSLKENPQKL